MKRRINSHKPKHAHRKSQEERRTNRTIDKSEKKIRKYGLTDGNFEEGENGNEERDLATSLPE